MSPTRASNERREFAVSKLIRELKIAANRNGYGVNLQPSQKNQVNIEHSALLNIGDTLGPVVVDWMLEQRGIDREKKVSKTRHLATIGSIIGRGKCDITVWGSGILKNDGSQKHSAELRLKRHRTLYHRKMDFRAVRGPYTREIILAAGYQCAQVYGDPAVLMPLIYQPRPCQRKGICLIPHHRTSISQETGGQFTLKVSPEMAESHGIFLLDPKTSDYRAFIDALVSAELVISSSLHGIILAESYGVPTVFLNWGMDDQPTKFHDWYRSTNRDTQSAKTIEQALETEPAPLPELDSMRKALLDSFPYDLWEN